MGDLPPDSTVPMDQSETTGKQHSEPQHEPQRPHVKPGKRPATSRRTTPSQPGTNYQASPHHAFQPQFDHSSHRPTTSRQGPFNMASVAGSLPQPNYPPEQYHHPGYPPRYDSSGSPIMVHPMQQVHPYGGQPQSSMAAPGYYPQMPQYYAPEHMSSGQPPQHMHPAPGIPYYSNQIPMGPQSTPYYNQNPRHPGQPQSPPMMGYIPPPPPPQQQQQQQLPRHQGGFRPQQHQQHSHRAALENKTVNDTSQQSNAVRGPPRKPRQSGHAIWIGNLPAQTELMTLVHHVCQEAPGLQSLFLISKSNCAFANFKDEESCNEAQELLHDSKFQSVRLVCRLRKTSPDGPSAQAAPTDETEETSSSTALDMEQEDGTAAQSDGVDGAEDQPTSPNTSSHKDRFFILKSLTTEDLDLSMRTGVWATQSHNEEALNAAFKAADNVYLVFSANKSGEYYGYARMTSPINEDPSAAIQFAPLIQSTKDSDLPKATTTEANDHTPAGRIVDDSARGTIFWEIESDESAGESEDEDEVPARKGNDTEEEMQTWGKPFQLEWLSQSRLPFFRTRGLRNPWNSNREVKIARDGTELEPSVGKRLIGLFNRALNQTQIPPNAQMPPGYAPGYTRGPPYGR